MSNCKNCNKKVSVFGKTFCSRSCSATFNNRNRAKTSSVIKCLHCNSEFQISQYESNTRKFCSHKCSTDFKVEASFQNSESKSNTSRASQRRYLINLRGHQCEVCKNTEWNNEPIPLELDHIDGNAGHNHRDNLRVICPNCHSQTRTYKGRNKGNGRKSRGLPQY